MEENNYTNPYESGNNNYENNYQNNYNYDQYANYGNPMVDELGRPMKNRFALKLIVGIILIVCCCVNFNGLIFGIVGLVYTSKANTAYNAGNPYEFRACAGVSAAMLWIGGILLALSIISYFTVGAMFYAIYEEMMQMLEMEGMI